jgi:peptidoglycan/xylan/chitin deacetylase (PgdA/CDA1 family)
VRERCSRTNRTIGIGAGLAAGAAAMAWAVRSPRSDVFGPSFWRGPRDRPAVALTFDDGPSESTPEILEILDRYGAPATFFQCGLNVRRLPGIARQVAAAGHEIGNHSYTHLLLSLRRAAMIEEEFAQAQQAILDTTGVEPVWMRAPFGVRWFGMRRAQRQLGLVGIMWTVIGYDWSLPSRVIAERVQQRTANGAIICLHDGRQLLERPDIRPTLEAVRILVPWIQEQGYRLETVSQLLCPTNSSRESET